MLWRLLPLSVGCAIALMVSSCVKPPEPLPPPPSAPMAKSVYRVGPAYQINGVYYYPKADLEDDETGVASVYAPDTALSLTANGEAFDQNTVAGAHRTLALPTIVQVTNLENGRFIRLRVNDRGPKAADRIIQLTRHAAELLGIAAGGAAKVHLHVVVADTVTAQSLAKQNGGDITTDEPAPPAVPHGAVVAQALPAPGSVAAAPAPAAPTDAVAIPSSAAAPLAIDAPPVLSPRPSSAPLALSPLSDPKTVPAAAEPPARPVIAASSKTKAIFIQAGSFAKDENARRLKMKLQALGPVEIDGVRINGANIYRVRLGPIATLEEANQMLTRATGAGATDAKIVFD
jgi:rare lipoprotein A